MKKKALSLALALVMCLGLLTMTAQANKAGDPNIRIQTADDECIDFSPSTDMSGDGWSYDSNSKRLTLNGFNGKEIWVYRAGTGVVVDLKGDNVCSDRFGLTHSGPDNDSATIVGDGTLTSPNVLFRSAVTMTSGTINSTGYLSIEEGDSIMTGGTINAAETNAASDDWPGAIHVTSSFRMTGGTLNVVGSEKFGICGEGKLSLEGGTVTAQSEKAAIWLSTARVDPLNINGRIIGGETAADTQALSICKAHKSGYFYVYTVSASELTVSEGKDAEWAGSSGAAKYVHIGNGQPQQPTAPDTPSTTLPTVENIPAAGTAVARTQNVLLDGKTVSFQYYAVKNAQGNETNYVKLRDLAQALNGTKAQFNVGWDGKISITSNTPYTAVGGEGSTPYSGDQPYTAVSDDPVNFNGTPVKLTSLQLKDSAGNGYTYYKLRDLGQLLNFNVTWNGSSIVVESDKPYIG